MVEVEESIRIDASGETVWAELADFGAIARWAPNVDHSSLASHSSGGVGTVRRVQVGRNALLERVVAWEPGASLSYAIEGLPPVVHSVINSWDIVDDGGPTVVTPTVVTLTSRIEPGPRPPHQLAARVVGRALGKASREMLAGLKSQVERSHVEESK